MTKWWIAFVIVFECCIVIFFSNFFPMISMHENTLYAIAIHKNRSITPFLTLWSHFENRTKKTLSILQLLRTYHMTSIYDEIWWRGYKCCMRQGRQRSYTSWSLVRLSPRFPQSDSMLRLSSTRTSGELAPQSDPIICNIFVQFHSLGCWGARQDSSTVAPLLPKHPGGHLCCRQ